MCVPPAAGAGSQGPYFDSTDDGPIVIDESGKSQMDWLKKQLPAAVIAQAANRTVPR